VVKRRGFVRRAQHDAGRNAEGAGANRSGMSICNHSARDTADGAVVSMGAEAGERGTLPGGPAHSRVSVGKISRRGLRRDDALHPITPRPISSFAGMPGENGSCGRRGGEKFARAARPFGNTEAID